LAFFSFTDPLVILVVIVLVVLFFALVAVLLLFGRVIFLLTADHVFDAMNKTVILGDNGNIIIDTSEFLLLRP
jgi:hypothetical protein